MADKFLYIQEGKNEGTLIAEDGGIAIIWHNGKHLVGQCYRERLTDKHLYKGLHTAIEEMIESSSNSSMFDFEEEDHILPLQLQEMADWLISGREGEFLDNLTFLDKRLKEKEVDRRVRKFLNNELFEEREIEDERNSEHIIEEL